MTSITDKLNCRRQTARWLIFIFEMFTSIILLKLSKIALYVLYDVYSYQ